MNALTYLSPDLRKQAALLFKQAASPTMAGGDMPFEQALSSLGHAVLKDKAPGLLDYEIGFQVVDKNDDNTRAVGVFGFKVGRQWLYAPIFFIEGDIKGQDLLYIKDEDLFVPMKENWLNYLIGKKPTVLGKQVGRDLSRQGVVSPNFFQFSKSPSKYAAAEDWLSGFLPAFGHAVTTTPDLASPQAMDLPTFLKTAGVVAVQALHSLVTDYPSLLQGIDRFYDKEAFDKAVDDASRVQPSTCVKSARNQEVISTPAGGLFPGVTPSTATTSGDTTTQTAKMAANISDDTQTALLFLRSHLVKPQHAALLNDDEREALIRRGRLVLDKRADEDVTRSYEAVDLERLQSPGESGLYEVLVSPDDFAECAVFMFPYDHTGKKRQCLVVRTDNKTWLLTHSSRIWTKEQKPRGDFEKWCGDLPEAKGSSSAQVLVGPHGHHATLPVYTLSRGTGGVFDADFVEHPAVDRPASTKNERTEGLKDRFTRMATKRHGKIVLTGARGTKFRAYGDALYIPVGTKSLKLHSGYCPCESDSEPPPILELANLVDLRMGIMRAADFKGLKIKKTASGYRLGESATLTEVDALEKLVASYGLRENVAETLLKRAADQGSTEVNLQYPESGAYPDMEKKAGPSYELQRGGPDAPPHPDVFPTTDPMTGGLADVMPNFRANIPATDVYGRTVTNREEHRPWPASQPHMVGGDNDGPPDQDKQTLGLAMRASQTGQKEVFDSSMIGSIVKRTKVESVLDDKLLGSSMDTMNQYGKALAHLYYNRDTWEDRFGKSEVPELEDLLQSTFENLGDATLRLREGTVDPGPDEGMLPDLDDKPV